MPTDTRAELPVIFDCNAGEDGLAEFEPEVQRGTLWLRDPAPTVEVQRREPYVSAPPAPRRWPFVLPVVLAGAVVGGAASWLGLGGGPPSLPSVPGRSALQGVSSEVPSRDVPNVEPVHASVSEPAATAPVTQPVPELAPARIPPAFEQTLAAVSGAYRARDAQALAAVWPGADTAALSHAFAELKYQALSFDRCALHATGGSSAMATCDVTIASAPKEGDPALQRRHESWSVLLEHSGDRWTINGVSVR